MSVGYLNESNAEFLIVKGKKGCSTNAFFNLLNTFAFYLVRETILRKYSKNAPENSTLQKEFSHFRP